MVRNLVSKVARITNTALNYVLLASALLTIKIQQHENTNIDENYCPRTTIRNTTEIDLYQSSEPTDTWYFSNNSLHIALNTAVLIQLGGIIAVRIILHKLSNLNRGKNLDSAIQARQRCIRVSSNSRGLYIEYPENQQERYEEVRNYINTLNADELQYLHLDEEGRVVTIKQKCYLHVLQKFIDLNLLDRRIIMVDTQNRYKFFEHFSRHYLVATLQNGEASLINFLEHKCKFNNRSRENVLRGVNDAGGDLLLSINSGVVENIKPFREFEHRPSNNLDVIELNEGLLEALFI